MCADDTRSMKTICMLLFTVFLAFAFGEDSTQRAYPGPGLRELEKKSAKVDRSTRDYHKAKVECLKKSENLKGKKLTDCIVEYQKEAK